jgi:hypothetical protein
VSILELILIAGGGLLALAAVAAVALAWRVEGGLLAMRDTPTLSVAEVAERHRWAAHGAAPFGQPVEVVGTIECDTPIQAPYSEALCVAYDYAVTDEREQLIGRPGSRQAREFEFGGHDAQQRHVPRFYVHDATGRVAVDPSGARFDMVETVARYEAYTGLVGGEHEIWREERALPLGNRVYVLGYLCDDGGAPLIGRHPSDPAHRFMISHRDERALGARVRRRAYALYLGAVLGAAGAVGAIIAALAR